jgi:hypothetical protein
MSLLEKAKRRTLALESGAGLTDNQPTPPKSGGLLFAAEKKKH